MPFISVAVASSLPAQFTNPDFIVETPEVFVAQPDLDGDGIPDIVVIDKETGILRPGLFDGTITWLEPVPGGVPNLEAVAAGNIEDFALDSIAITSSTANRINLFSLDGDTLNRSPRSIYNEVWGLEELAAIEEGSSETPDTAELIGLSQIFEPSSPGARDYLTWTGSELVSYSSNIPQPTAPQRDYNHFLLEEGVPVLGFFEEWGSGLDTFVLNYILEGTLETIPTVFPIANTAKVIQASFDRSGQFQYLFHSGGSTQVQFFVLDGGSLSYASDLFLSEPASQLFPLVVDGFAGFLALSMDGFTLTPYAFDGSSAPEEVATISPASEYPVSASVALPDGSLMVLSGDPIGDAASHAELFAFDGTAFQPVEELELPPLQLLTEGSNVLLFAETPFIDENPSLTGRLSAGVWTSAVAVGATVEAVAEGYEGTAAGLANATLVDLGTPPVDTAEALGNQVEDDISLSFPLAPVGAVPGAINPSPQAGTYGESILVEFIPSDPSVDVFYRVLPSGAWKKGTGPVGPHFQDISYAFFGQHADGRRTPIGTADYTFSVDPSDLDSDGDSIPDYVEIDAGLDPVNSGDDADGDGYSDLVELLAGSDPASSASTPPSRALDTDEDGFSDLEETVAGTDPGDSSSFPANPGVLNFQNVFDLVAVPYSHDGTGAANPFVSSLEEELETPDGDPLATSVRLFNPSAALLGFDRTALHNLGGVAHPSAYIDEVSIAWPGLFMVVSTDRTFNIDVASADRRLGRQIAALIPVPEVELEPVSYAYGSSGGTLSAEAAGWLNAAQSHYLSIDRPLVVREFNLYDTLALLLVELKVEEILQARGLLQADRLTLTGFRSNEVPVDLANAPGDGSRTVTVPPSTLAALRYKTDSLPGYRLDVISETIGQSVDLDAAAAVQDLRSVAEEIYRISAATANDNPGTLVAPLDALRQFLRTGTLDNTGYDGSAPLDPTTLGTAYTAVAYILEQPMSRPVEFRELKVPAGGLTGPCTLLTDTSSGETVSLVNFQGDPFSMPDAFSLPAGTVILVEGYADVSSDCGADLTLEVIPQPQLVTLPVQATGDANANLVPDDLEDLYTGSLDPFGDSDGDGYSDLQEILAGTNPLLIGDIPALAPVDLGPPVIAIEDTATTFVFTFQYPADYAEDINFRLFSGPGLDSMTNNTGFHATHMGGGAFQLTINKPLSLPAFYRFQMILD